MNLEEIKVTDSITVYRGNLEYDKQSIIDEVYTNIDIYLRTSKGNPGNFKSATKPGIQSDLVVRNGEWENLYNKIKNIILNDFYKKPEMVYTSIDWVYVSDSRNDKSGFHHHLSMQDRTTTGEWNYTFYVQMPDVLHGHDGELLFKDSVESNEIYTILPKEGEFYIFDAKHLHAPETNRSSKKERIVLAGTFCELDLSKNKKKVESTLL